MVSGEGGVNGELRRSNAVTKKEHKNREENQTKGNAQVPIQKERRRPGAILRNRWDG